MIKRLIQTTGIMSLLGINLAIGTEIIPSHDMVRDLIVNSSLSEQGQQNLELADVKITIPTENLSDMKQEKCVVLLHGQNNMRNLRDVSHYLASDGLSGNGQCDLLDHAKNQIAMQKKKINSWNFTFHFGFTRTFYDNTDMRIRSDRVDVLIRDFEFEERTSAGFYNPANWKSWMDAFRWIDEPTNHFILTAEKNGHSIILSVFHPKFLKKSYQTKFVSGLVDGVSVNQFMEINEPFDGYNNQAGEMYLVRFENTHMQMAWQLGYGYEIKLLDRPGYGALSVTPAILVGVMSGEHYDVYLQEGEYWNYDDHKDQHQIQGGIISTGVRVNYKIKNFNLFVDGKQSYAKLQHGFGDANGVAQYNLNYRAISFGVGYTFPQRNNKKKKRKPVFK